MKPQVENIPDIFIQQATDIIDIHKALYGTDTWLAKFSEEQVQFALTIYSENEEMSLRQAAQEANMSHEWLRQLLKQRNQQIRQSSGGRKPLDLPDKELARLYLQGETSVTLAEEYEVHSTSTILRHLRDAGVEIRPKGSRVILPIENIARDRESFPQPSYADLAKKYNVPIMTLWRQMQKYYTSR